MLTNESCGSAQRWAIRGKEEARANETSAFQPRATHTITSGRERNGVMARVSDGSERRIPGKQMITSFRTGHSLGS
jgi:hypothetical protein